MILKKFCKGQPPVNSASYMRKKIKSVMKIYTNANLIYNLYTYVFYNNLQVHRAF